jgi:hypothetical protein
MKGREHGFRSEAFLDLEFTKIPGSRSSTGKTKDGVGGAANLGQNAEVLTDNSDSARCIENVKGFGFGETVAESGNHERARRADGTLDTADQ